MFCFQCHSNYLFHGAARWTDHLFRWSHFCFVKSEKGFENFLLRSRPSRIFKLQTFTLISTHQTGRKTTSKHDCCWKNHVKALRRNNCWVYSRTLSRMLPVTSFTCWRLQKLRTRHRFSLTHTHIHRAWLLWHCPQHSTKSWHLGRRCGFSFWKLVNEMEMCHIQMAWVQLQSESRDESSTYHILWPAIFSPLVYQLVGVFFNVTWDNDTRGIKWFLTNQPNQGDCVVAQMSWVRHIQHNVIFQISPLGRATLQKDFVWTRQEENAKMWYDLT